MKSEKRASFEKVHYLLRPAKNIQRKMLSETFQQLGRVGGLARYEYVGFGSIYFGDFTLFHRTLGLENMTSIEKEDPARATFNIPFKCVTVLSGTANEKLPEIDWKRGPAIVWLDYDYGLEKEVLEDIKQVAASVLPGSFLAITLDATEDALKAIPQSEVFPIDEEKYGAASLLEQLNLKCDVSLPNATDLTYDGITETYRGLIQESIGNSVNSLRDPEGKDNLAYRQVLNFRYSDGCRMMTTGGVFLEASENGQANFDQLEFNRLDFYRPNSAYFEIEVPKLTLHEIRELNRNLPTLDAAAIPVPISNEDKSLYEKVYRYFPTFAEADVT
jgi:hypothetical protein